MPLFAMIRRLRHGPPVLVGRPFIRFLRKRVNAKNVDLSEKIYYGETMKGKNGLCVLMSWYVPWALMIVGGAISAVLMLSGWGKEAAYLVALGLVILAASAALKLLRPTNG